MSAAAQTNRTAARRIVEIAATRRNCRRVKRWFDGRRQIEKFGWAARFGRTAGARRGARAGAARARHPYRGIAPSARRDDRGFAPRRAVSHPAAEAGRRQRIAVPLDRRAGLGDRQGGRIDRLGAGQSRGASLDARDVPETGAGRGVGPVAGQSDRLGAGLSARPRPPRRWRLPGQRALAVFERRRSVLVEPARRDNAGRGGRHQPCRASSCCRPATTRSSTPGM